MTSSDDALLAAFYPDPTDAVWARYCWALLDSGPEHSINSLLDATHREHAAFLLRHQSVQKKQSDDLTSVEARHAERADRLAYCCSLLWRLSVIEHHSAAASPTLVLDAAKASEVSEAAADTLRAIRRARLATKRLRRPPP